MIISPLQNTAAFLGGQWFQKRPHVTQWFGENPQIYEQFGHNGHNGLDFRASVGTSLFAPIEGTVKIVGDQGNKGYGKYIEIWKDNLKIVLAHLSSVAVVKGEYVSVGHRIGLTGNTGFSSGPHLHMTMKFMENGKVLNPNNGYGGAIDPEPFMLCWKGTLKNPVYE